MFTGETALKVYYIVTYAAGMILGIVIMIDQW